MLANRPWDCGRVVKTIFEKIVEINRQQGITILLVDKSESCFGISRYGYVLETGQHYLQDESARSARTLSEKRYLGGGNSPLTPKIHESIRFILASIYGKKFSPR